MTPLGPGARRSRIALGPLLLLAPLLIAAGLAVPSPAGAEPPPNIVVIMVDDMRADELAWMPRTRRLLGQYEMTNFVSNHPLCCPARAEFVTGQFGQTNGVLSNPVNELGGYDDLRDQDNTIARWFDDAGYSTSFAGKFINNWEPANGEPAGWDQFSALTEGTYNAYDFDVWRDGVTQEYTDVLHNNDFVTQESIAQITTDPDAPFFHYAAYTGPHGYKAADGSWLRWPVPARRHEDVFAKASPPSRSAPSYQKTGFPTTKSFRQRIRSLQSVDEGVQSIVRATKLNGTFDNTVFVFTSDNGYLLGEHGLIGKNLPYEEVLRVPLLATGPGIPTGQSSENAMITDLASSLSALAGITPGRPQDGRPLMFRPGSWERLLVQGAAGRHDWWWRGVRTQKWLYVRYTDRPPVLFNLKRDPFQLNNLHGSRPRLTDRLRNSIPEVRDHERTRDRIAPLARMSKPNG